MHNKIKFSLIVLTISLIVALVVVLSAFSGGLVSGMTGAIGRLEGDVAIFQGDTYFTLERSVLTPETLNKIHGADGVKSAYGVDDVMVSVDSSEH